MRPLYILCIRLAVRVMWQLRAQMGSNYRVVAAKNASVSQGTEVSTDVSVSPHLSSQ